MGLGVPATGFLPDGRRNGATVRRERAERARTAGGPGRNAWTPLAFISRKDVRRAPSAGHETARSHVPRSLSPIEKSSIQEKGRSLAGREGFQLPEVGVSLAVLTRDRRPPEKAAVFTSRVAPSAPRAELINGTCNQRLSKRTTRQKSAVWCRISTTVRPVWKTGFDYRHLKEVKRSMRGPKAVNTRRHSVARLSEIRTIVSALIVRPMH